MNSANIARITTYREVARRVVASLACLSLFLSTSVYGQELPSGGSVAAGQASISTPTPQNMVVNQASTNAIINWNSFSIGSGGTVQFNNGSGATLNRVT